MVKVWGVDPSSKCGLAIWDSASDISSAHCEVIANEDEADYYWYAGRLARIVRERVQEFGRPDIVVIEQGSESTQGTGVNGLIWIWNVIGTVSGLIGVYGIPVATIHPATWRKPFYGHGFVPPQKPVMEKAIVNGREVRRQVIERGKPKFKNDWKTAAIQKCGSDGVDLPPQKTIAHNAAEAVGIAHSWKHASVINPSFHDAFKAMKLADGDRDAPLFSAGKLRSMQNRSAA